MEREREPQPIDLSPHISNIRKHAIGDKLSPMIKDWIKLRQLISEHLPRTMELNRLLAKLAAIGPIKWAIAHLEDPKMARILISSHTFIFSIDGNIRDYYQNTYVEHQIAASNSIVQDGTSLDNDVQQACGASHQMYQLTRGIETPSAKIEWQDFPRPRRLFTGFRMFTNTWEIYVTMRFFFSGALESLIESFITPLELPIKCYLAGRFVLSPKMAEMAGAVYALTNVSWRIAQLIAQPYPLSMVYFLMLSEHDRELVYSRLESNHLGQLTLDKHDHLNPKEQFLLDTMCYCIKQPTKIVFKLRPNRTRAAHLALRRLMARTTLVSIVIFIFLSLSLTIVFSILVALDSYYLLTYPNCDPQLQQLADAGQLGPWSVTLTSHHKFAIISDYLENNALWIELGFVARFWPVFIYLISYDSIMHWNGIKQKIEQLEEEARSAAAKALHTRLRHSFSERIDELIAEMSDFFGQIGKTNRFMSNYLLFSTTVNLFICALYTYFVQAEGINHLPLSVAAALGDYVIGTAIVWYGLLVLHRSCARSYVKLSSLMAYDETKSIHNYAALLEFYTKQRSCFTLFNQYPFTATKYLAVIGWAFTCFCLVAGNLKRGLLR